MSADNPAIVRAFRLALPHFLHDFNKLDSDNSGYLEATEIREMVCQLGLAPTEEELRVRLQLIRHFQTCTTDIYLHN